MARRLVVLPALAVLISASLAGTVSVQAAEPSDQAELNLVFVLDGLRPDSISYAQTPNLFRLRQQGVNFPNSHSVVPTVTRVNSTVLGTGSQPGTNGILGNDVYLPSVSATSTVSTGSANELLKLRAAEGRISLAKTLGERLEAEGKKFVALGSGTSGSTLLLNPTAPDGTGVMINTGATDGPLAFPAKVGQQMTQRYGAPPSGPGTSKVDYAITVLNDYVLPDLKPDVVMTWMTEPDGSQHDHGVGSPEALAAIRNDDRNIGLVLDRLRQRGQLDRTNIMVVSDHGFSVTDGVVNLGQELVKAGLKQSATSTDVVVTSTGSAAVHVKDRDPGKIQAISEFLLRRQDIDTVFTAVRRPAGGQYRVANAHASVKALAKGWVDGTFSLELIGHANAERGADIVATFPWSSKPNAFGVAGTAVTSGGGSSVTGPRTGNASTHGSFSPFDVRNTFFGWGVDFKDGVISNVPAGNVDVAPTLLALEGVFPRGMDGRVLSEGLYGGPRPAAVPSSRQELVVTSRDGSYRGQVDVSVVEGRRYIDQSRRLATGSAR